jgi:DNA-binding transcriptional ArsR family regulator
MATNVDLAAIGRLLATPARAAMIDALFDGQAWSVRKLAAAARVSPSTACEHLQRLRQAGLVVAARKGRYQLYRLKNDEVADALELLGTLAPPLPPRGLADSARNEALHAARTCYDHLAGRLGVAITDALVGRGYLSAADRGFMPTRAGDRAFAAVGIDTESLHRDRRPVARACLDWSERRPHLAGALGAALLARLESAHGIERLPRSRVVRLRPPGRALLSEMGVGPAVGS